MKCPHCPPYFTMGGTFVRMRSAVYVVYFIAAGEEVFGFSVGWFGSVGKDCLLTYLQDKRR